jgi:hypothetical protein
MKSAAAIVVDGVLRKPVGGTPIPQGVALYHGLCAAFNVVLVVEHSVLDMPELQRFLDVEQLYSHGSVAYGIRPGMSGAETRVRQAERLRNAGYALDLVVEPNPEVAAALYAAGFNVLHFMHAAYQRPDWRPDFEGGQRPWDELVAEQQRAAALRAADNRTGSAE